MSLLEKIKNSICPPKGPAYDLADMEYNYRKYEEHVCKACDILSDLLWNRDDPLITKVPEALMNPTDTIGEVRWVKVPVIRSWVVKEFARKIRAFRVKGRPETPSSMSKTDFVRHVREPIGEAEARIDAAEKHSRIVDAAIAFFLCDERSTFDRKASLDGGECTSRDISEWYVRTGLRTVRDQFGVVDGLLRKALSAVKAAKGLRY